jgi:hypothetical protein
MYNVSVRHRNSVNASGSAPGIQLPNRLTNNESFFKLTLVQRVPVPPPIYFLVFRHAYIATGSGFFNPFTGTRLPPPFSVNC